MGKDRPTDNGGVRDQLPPEVREFLDRVIANHLMRFDVLKFFYQNPYAILTISDLSVWVAREERPLAEALQQLATLGYLAQSPASSAFTLTPSREKRRRLEEFFGYLEEQPDVARKRRVSLRRRLEAE